MRDQDRKRPVPRPIEHDGKVMTLSAWAKHLNIARSCLQARLDMGSTVKRTFETAGNPAKPVPKVSRCFCGTRRLSDGMCPHKCPPEAAPRALRAAAARRRENERKLNSRGSGELLRSEEVRAAKDPDPHAKVWRSYWTKQPGKRRCWTVGCRGCKRCKPAANGSQP